MSRKETWFRAGLVVAVAMALLFSALAFVESQTQIQEMSASGYLLALDDGTGTVQFSVTDAGVVSAADFSATDDLIAADDATIGGDLVVTDAADVGGLLNYGANNMYPLGYGTSGQEIVCATTTITGENQAVTVTGITTVTYGFAWLITDPGTGDGDPYMVTTDAAPGNGTIVVNVWQDSATAASSGAAIGYCGIGDE